MPVQIIGLPTASGSNYVFQVQVSGAEYDAHNGVKLVFNNVTTPANSYTPVFPTPAYPGGAPEWVTNALPVLSNSGTSVVYNYSVSTANFYPADTYSIVPRAYSGSAALGEEEDLIAYSYTPGGGGGAVCFLGSAPVLTPAGYRRIDSLAAGDLVRTADGRDVAVVRAKHQRIEVPSIGVNPYVIPKGQFGATENLAISPRHCVAVPGRGMVEARDLGLRQLSMRAAFDYYNLELPEWDNMVVAGVEVESLAPRKRVVMTVAELAKLAAGVPIEKLSKVVTVLADGRVAVQMARTERRGVRA